MKKTPFFVFIAFFLVNSNAASLESDELTDADEDGLLDIYTLANLDKMRNDLTASNSSGGYGLCMEPFWGRVDVEGGKRPAGQIH